MRPLLDELHAAVAEATGFTPAAVDWAPTPQRNLGDVAFPCFKIAKQMGKNPAAVAQEIAPLVKSKLKSGSLIRDIVPTGPYLNVFFAAMPLHKWLQERLKARTLGATSTGSGKTLVIDFSSPNMAKEIGLHHLRSTAIGNALANVGELHGYKVVRLNYLGDWGTSHGKNIMALKKFGSEEELKRQGLGYILDLYVRYNQAIKDEEAKNNGKSELAEQAREAFKKLEEGDPECRRIWALLREISVREAKQLYERLGIHFDHYDGEALYENRLQGVVNEVTAKIGTRKSDGALVCDIPGQSLPVLLQKDDGASLYITRDLAAAEDRYERFHYDLSFYVVAVQQKFHFEQLFGLLKLLQKPYADRCEHIPFGMLSFGSKTMKSREGNIIFLKDVLDEATNRALAIIQEKNPQLAGAQDVAQMVGQGAVLFSDLAQNRVRDISFDWDQALSFEGDTAPLIQYTHARCCSLLSKGKAHLATLPAPKDPLQEALAAATLLDQEPAVRQLLGDMAFFQTYSERAWNERDPSQIATTTLNVAKSFNHLYHKIRFLDESSPARLKVLLQLTEGTQLLLAHGLKVLGIRAPSEM